MERKVPDEVAPDDSVKVRDGRESRRGMIEYLRCKNSRGAGALGVYSGVLAAQTQHSTPLGAGRFGQRDGAESLR